MFILEGQEMVEKKHWNELWKRHKKNFLLEFLDNIQSRGCFQIYLKLLKCKKLPKKINIIELGSGTGKLSLKLYKFFNNCKCTLVDYSKSALELSKRKFKENNIHNQNFIYANVLEFKTKKKYDIVHSGGLIEHFSGSELNKIVRKHVELCKKNGLIIIMVPAPLLWYKLYRKTMECLGKWPKNIETPMDEHYLVQLTEKNGIKVLDSTMSRGLVRSSFIIGTPKK